MFFFLFLVINLCFGETTVTDPGPVGVLPSGDETTTNSNRGGSTPEYQQPFKYIAVNKNISLDSYEGKIDGYQLECEQGPDGKIGFCGGKCSADVGDNVGANVSHECAVFIDRYMPECIEAIDCKDSVAFCGTGGHAKRRVRGGRGPSRHSTGDALDLYGIRCGDQNRNKIDLDFNQSAHSNPVTGKRYNAFVECWRSKVEEVREALRQLEVANPGGGAISCEGSQEPSNKQHNDHIHLSCPAVRKNVVNI